MHIDQNRLQSAREALARITDVEGNAYEIWSAGFGWNIPYEQTGMNEFEPRRVLFPWKIARPFVTAWIYVGSPVREAVCALLTGHHVVYDGEDGDAESGPLHVYAHCQFCGRDFSHRC